MKSHPRETRKAKEAGMARRKSNRELDREIAEMEQANRVVESGDVYSSLLPGSTDYQVVGWRADMRAIPSSPSSRRTTERTRR